MLKKTYLILSIILLTCSSHAQQIQYKEKVNNDYTRFFYDENYFLVDKDCEFKAIERVVAYDSLNFLFNGEFKDFDKNGKVILHGFYKNGLRNGKFTAYHPNGNIKWETAYHDSKQSNEWKYYYPDGKPLLVLALEEGDFRIMSFWDKTGAQKVKEGQGNYDMTFPIIGFTDHGYTSYRRFGKIANGKPDGIWYINFIVDAKRKTEINVYNEIFTQGMRSSFSLNNNFFDYFIPYEDFLLVPSDFFGRAEFFFVHSCSFDDYSGFKTFIGRKFNDELDDFNINTADTTFQYKANYSVSNKGRVVNMKIVASPDELSKKEKDNIEYLFESLTYFIPSVLDGSPIKDNIILTGNFSTTNGKIKLEDLKIEREKGQ